MEDSFSSIPHSTSLRVVHTTCKQKCAEKREVISIFCFNTRDLDTHEMGSREVGPFTMDAGDFYVGDLQHVVDVATWDEIVKLFPTFNNGDMQGKFTLASGRVLCMFNLPSNGFRRRDYIDMQGRHYYMNSSLMGITLAAGLEAEYKDVNLSTCSRKKGEDFEDMMDRLGNIVTYKDPFECNSIITVIKDGSIMGGDSDVALISFGTNVVINTDESDNSEESGDDEVDGDHGMKLFFKSQGGRIAMVIAGQEKREKLKLKIAAKGAASTAAVSAKSVKAVKTAKPVKATKTVKVAKTVKVVKAVKVTKTVKAVKTVEKSESV